MRWWIATLWLLWAQNAWSQTCAGQTMKITEPAVRITALPSELPPSRMVLSFDSTEGEHRAVEWDALVSTRLGRVVVLPRGEWQVSVWSKPLRNPHAPGVDPAWRGAGLTALKQGKATICKMHLVPRTPTMAKAGDPATTQSPVQGQDAHRKVTLQDPRYQPSLTLRFSRMPSLKETIEALSRTGGGRLGGAIVPRARAFGMVPELADDLFGTVAAVVARRGKASMEAIVQDMIIKACKAVSVLHDPGAAADQQSRPLLPSTCRALRSLRLDTLASAGTVLRDALIADLMEYGMDWALNTVVTNLSETSAGCFETDPSTIQALEDLWKHVDLEDLKSASIRKSMVDKLRAAFLNGRAVNGQLDRSLKDALDALEGAKDKYVADQLSRLRVALVRAHAHRIRKHPTQKRCVKASGITELVRQVQGLIRRGADDVDAARAVVSALARVIVQWTDEFKQGLDPNRPRVALMIAFANASYCLATGGCDVRQIEDLTRRPGRFFLAEEPDQDDARPKGTQEFFDRQALQEAKQPPGSDRGPIAGATTPPPPPPPADGEATSTQDGVLLGETVRLTQQLLSILSARAGDARTTRRAAVDVAYTVVTWNLLDGLLAQQQNYTRVPDILFSARSERKGACDGFEQAVERHACMTLYRLESTRILTHAAIDRDASAALTAAVRLVESSEYFTSKLKRFSRLVGPVVAYVRTYEDPAGDGAEKDAAARREAREKAFEALIDATTSRIERPGASIFSLGGALVAQAGLNTDAAFHGPLSLPVGLAYDVLPDGGCCGAHLQASFLDLGTYMLVRDDADQVEWGDVLAPTLDIGMTFGGPRSVSTPPWIGARVGWAPFLEDDGAFFFGLAAGAYVPFFDFN